ncbi:MAG TPA: hypothetical protein VGD78_19160 [Chthoniobacterales bacterium]
MNTRAAWSIVARECTRRSVQLESKLERHAGLLLWPFSLLAVSGLFFHYPTLPASPTHCLLRSAPLATGLVWALLPFLFRTGDRFSKGIEPKHPGWWPALKLVLGLQQVLIGALGGFLALFVIAVVRHNVSWCAALLETLLLLLVSFQETLDAEERLRLCKRASWGGRPGPGWLSQGGFLRIAGSAVLLGCGMLQLQGLLG